MQLQPMSFPRDKFLGRSLRLSNRVQPTESKQLSKDEREQYAGSKRRRMVDPKL